MLVLTRPSFSYKMTPIGFGLTIAGLGYTFYDLGNNGYPYPKKVVDDYKGLNRDNTYQIHDPLVLDLDGDGIETTSPNQFQGTLFDLNANGIKNATGWVKGDDGVLVLDKNGNGIINNGAELFGDATTLKNGQKAEHGFAALADLDSNDDGKIDQNDADFHKLKVWRDLNGDGISQKGELFSLSELGITALNLDYTHTAQSLGGGNTLAQVGSFEKADGTTGKMGDVNFHVDTLHTQYIDKVELTPEQAQVANLKGVGWVRDLREAAALSPKLAGILQAYTAAETKAVQHVLLPELVLEWAKTSPEYKEYKASILEATSPSGGGGNPIAVTPGQAGHHVLDMTYYQAFQQEQPKIGILDAFSGIRTEQLYYRGSSYAQYVIKTIRQTYADLSDNIYQALLTQTRLKPYLNEIAFEIKDGKFSLDYSGVQAAFNQVFATNPQKAFVDLGEFLTVGKSNWAEGMVLFAQYVQAGRLSGSLNVWLDELGTDAVNHLATQNGTDGNDTLHAIGLLDRDVLSGGKGNDVLIAGRHPAILDGGEGSDIYVIQSQSEQVEIHNHDTSAGRTDTIVLNGVVQEQLSFARRGDDLVLNIQASPPAVRTAADVTMTVSAASGEYRTIVVKEMFKGDTFTDHIDRIKLGDGTVITLTDITRELLKGSNSNDTLIGYGTDDVIHAMDGDDVIEGRGGNDTIYAGAGNDRIDAGAGNDMIYLQSGNNDAYGGDGDDTVVSGSGNDFIQGGIGSDTYVFGQNFGQDTVLNFNPRQADTDIIQFTDGIKQADLSFRRHEKDLLIRQHGTDNSITVAKYFEQDAGGDWAVQDIRFADHAHIGINKVKELVIQPTDGDDTLYAYDSGSKLAGGRGNDTLIGGIGNDTLIGGLGKNTLIGGKGDDILIGSQQEDTYIFHKGDGRDLIHPGMVLGGTASDHLIFKDISISEAHLQRSGQDLIIKGYHENDAVTVKNYFSHIYGNLRSISFSDQTLKGGHHIKKAISTSGTVRSVNEDASVSGADDHDILKGGSSNNESPTLLAQQYSISKVIEDSWTMAAHAGIL